MEKDEIGPDGKVGRVMKGHWKGVESFMVVAALLMRKVIKRDFGEIGKGRPISGCNGESRSTTQELRR